MDNGMENLIKGINKTFALVATDMKNVENGVKNLENLTRKLDKKCHKQGKIIAYLVLYSVAGGYIVKKKFEEIDAKLCKIETDLGKDDFGDDGK